MPTRIKTSTGLRLVDDTFKDRPPPGFSAPATHAPLPAQFSYADMAPDVASEAKATAARIRDRLSKSVVETGRDLIAMKTKLAHGLFLSWLDAEVGMGERSAQNYMNAAGFVEGKSENISYLPAVALYALASPSAPTEAVRAIVAAVEAGERMPVSVIKEKLSDAVAAEKKAAIKKTAEELELEKEKEKKRKAAEVAKEKKRQEEREAQEAVREEKARAVAALLTDIMGGAGVIQLMEQLHGTDWWRVERLFKPSFSVSLSSVEIEARFKPSASVNNVKCETEQ